MKRDSIDQCSFLYDSCPNIEIVPSSARSAASSAQPLPPHLEPLLAAPLEEIKKVVSGLIPSKSTRSVLEEAEWEDDNEDGTFGRELLLQCT